MPAANRNRNPEKQSAYFRRWMDKNREKRLADVRDYMRHYRKRRKAEETPEQAADRRSRRNSWERDHYQANKEQYRAKERKKGARRREIPSFRIANSIRLRIYGLLKGGKSRRSTELLGCDFKFLVSYIEKQWLHGMSWSNYGLGIGKWQLDHIKPCAAFDLTSDIEQKICFHYSNLRPLWSSENISKGSLWNGVRHRYKIKIHEPKIL